MAIKYLDAKRIRALSSDTLPTDVPAGTISEITDNYSYRWFDGTDWLPVIPVPETISSLYAWYDCSDLDSITMDGSNLVSKLENKEGTTARDLVQTTADNKPTFQADNGNGIGNIVFGVDWLRTASACTAITMPITIIFVGLPVEGGGQHFGWAEWGGSPNMEKSSVVNKYQVHWGVYFSVIESG